MFHNLVSETTKRFQLLEKVISQPVDFKYNGKSGIS